MPCLVIETSEQDGPGEAQATADWLGAQGIEARVGRDFQNADEVWPDVWTSPLDPRLAHKKLSCLADYLLKTRDVIGITGTAGKTTTAWLSSQLIPAVVSSRARAQNLWPGPGLLNQTGTIVAELTSSHLAFCHHSPRIAAITNFWPDHLEIHGSLEEYRQAKARLFQFQQPDHLAVLPWHDRAAQEVAEASPARRCWYSTGEEPPDALVRVFPWREGIRVEGPLGHRQLDLEPSPALLCALAVAEANGLAWQIPSELQLPPHRASRWGRLVDDTLAATPRKASYHIQPGCCLVAGGLLQIAGQPVHSHPLEQPALKQWLQIIRERCARVDLFGPAGAWLAAQIPGSHCHPDVESAVQAALQASPGEILISPGFPMPLEERLLVQSMGPKSLNLLP